MSLELPLHKRNVVVISLVKWESEETSTSMDSFNAKPLDCKFL